MSRKNSKLFITLGTGVTEYDAALCVARVVAIGRISSGAFCFASRLTVDSKELLVFSTRTRAGSDTFRVELDHPLAAGGIQ